MTSTHPTSWAQSPGAARQQWHTDAQEREEARLKEEPNCGTCSDRGNVRCGVGRPRHQPRHRQELTDDHAP